eukprot:jgi/Botrbrau1/15198/Bobra.0149s0059.2
MQAMEVVGLDPEEAKVASGETHRLPTISCACSELEDVKWVAQSTVWYAMQGKSNILSVPGPDSMAYLLLLEWCKSPRKPQHVYDGISDYTFSPPVNLKDIADVHIGAGTFKYMLIRVTRERIAERRSFSKLFVRCKGAYHRDIMDNFESEVFTMGMMRRGRDTLKVEPLGGGRIEHNPETQEAKIYGYSSEYGQAPHHVTAAILSRNLPFHNITVSYDGC